MDKKLKILLTAAEVAPIAKVGGLGDVIGALPKALVKLNLQVKIIIPFYGLIDRKKYKIKLIKKDLTVATSIFQEKINLWQTFLPKTKIKVYLIEHKFFSGKKIYSSKFKKNVSKIYPADLADIEKYVFFSHAVLEAVKAINFRPDIIHLNDWHTAAITVFLKTIYKNDRYFKKTKTLYTIHNLANQGITSPGIIKLNNIKPDLDSLVIDLKNGDINLMAQGIINADILTTVSPTYAREILTPDYAAGLEKVLDLKKNNLHGILNGIDTDLFNPETDNFIAQKYYVKSPKGKILNKLALQKQLGLPININVALVCLISRLVRQKGLDLITEKFARLNCQFIFLGAGERKYEEQLIKLAKKYPKKISTNIKFDDKLAQLIYAGSDIFLMPSRFEPCGLGQMIAMRYGTVPIVHATGGLKDTVKNYPATAGPRLLRWRQGGRQGYELKKANGFSFDKLTSAELLTTLRSALTIYYNQPGVWRQLQLNGMAADFSWDKPALEYLRLYKKL